MTDFSGTLLSGESLTVPRFYRSTLLLGKDLGREKNGFGSPKPKKGKSVTPV